MRLKTPKPLVFVTSPSPSENNNFNIPPDGVRDKLQCFINFYTRSTHTHTRTHTQTVNNDNKNIVMSASTRDIIKNDWALVTRNLPEIDEHGNREKIFNCSNRNGTKQRERLWPGDVSIQSSKRLQRTSSSSGRRSNLNSKTKEPT